jgi:hypothetical protein
LVCAWLLLLIDWGVFVQVGKEVGGLQVGELGGLEEYCLVELGLGGFWLGLGLRLIFNGGLFVGWFFYITIWVLSFLCFYRVNATYSFSYLQLFS